MSTFDGIIPEFPGIAIDRFEVLTSKLFFLSHCHWDHMRGLDCNKDKLQGKIVMTEISNIFVKKQFGITDDQVFILKLSDVPSELTYEYEGVEYSLCVTALPAQHCPGSVMFLLQSAEKSILYTGDFRISSGRFERYQCLKDITIDELYLDSTFLTENYNYFPTQVESVREICTLINQWLKKNTENQVVIKAPAQYSLEFLFMNIARKCKEKVYVPKFQQDKYIYFPDLDGTISCNKYTSRVFLDLKDSEKLHTVSEQNVLTLKPSALFWRYLKKNQSFVKAESENVYRVAYSSHCSFTELQEFVEFVKPGKVFLNVANAETSKAAKVLWGAKETVAPVEEDNEMALRLMAFQKRMDQIREEQTRSTLLPKRIKLL